MISLEVDLISLEVDLISFEVDLISLEVVILIDEYDKPYTDFVNDPKMADKVREVLRNRVGCMYGKHYPIIYLTNLN